MTFYIAQIDRIFYACCVIYYSFLRKLAKRQAQTVLRKLNYTRRHNENPAINPRDVESSGGSCVRGLGVLVPTKASL